MSQLFLSGSQIIGASAPILPMNIQGWFPFRIDWFDLLAVQGTLKSLLQHHNSKKYQFFGTQPSLWSNFLIRNWKSHSFDYMNFRQQSDISIS